MDSQALERLLEAAAKQRERDATEENERIQAEEHNMSIASTYNILEHIATVKDLVKRCDAINTGKTEYSAELCLSWRSDCRNVGTVIHEQGGCDLMMWVVDAFVPRVMHCNFDQGFDGVGTGGDLWVH